MSNKPDCDSWLTKEEAALFLDVSGKTVARLAVAQAVQKGLRKRPGLPPVAVYHPGDLQRVKTRREPAPFVRHVDMGCLTPEIREFLETFTREIARARKVNCEKQKTAKFSVDKISLREQKRLLAWIEEELEKLLKAVSNGTPIGLPTRKTV